MSKTIDERVVEMQFDNKQFESNIQTSLSTIERLKKSLNMDGATKGFDNLDKAAKKVDMTGLGSAVESVKIKFSALEVLAVTALTNIANSAINAGKRMVSALTIDPIKTGFAEYETQIGAIQTILANTSHEGTNLQQVNRALDELNLYADKTIYNFTQMTRNIGTFTAAGVGLQTSVDSIKGIANLAAISGSTSQQASTAMYQLSQALAAGRVSLMDWNSVVNAGMGGKVFQDALVRTSELLGTGAQAAIDYYGSFRESLTQGEWLTTEVLTETLKQFAGAYTEADLIQQGFSTEQAKAIAEMAKTAEDAATKVKTFTQLWDTLKESAQSGWTSTWEILIGDFEEAKELLTEISDVVGNVISKSAEARNELLSGALSSGWKQLLNQGIQDEAGYIEAIQEVARKSGDAFDKMVADSDNFTDALKKGLKEGVISSETLSDAVFVLQGKMSGMSAEELKAAGYTSEMVEQIEHLASGLKDGSVSMDEFTEKMIRPSGRENIIQALWNAAKGLMDVLSTIKEAFRDIFPPVTSEQLYKMTEKLREFTENLKLSDTASKGLKFTFKGLFAILDIIKQAFGAVLTAIKPLFGSFDDLGEGILGFTGGIGDAIVKFDELIKKSGAFQAVGEGVAKVVTTITTVLQELVHDVLERLQTRMSQAGDAVDKMQSAMVTAITAIGKTLAGFQFLELLKTIWNTVTRIVSSIIKSLGELGSSFTENFGGVIDVLNGISLSAIALGINKFVNSFKKAIEDSGGLKNTVISILNEVRSCLETFQTRLKSETLNKIATAVAILVGSLTVLSLVDSDKLNAALGAITVLFIDLMASMSVFNKISGQSFAITKSVPAIIGVAAAVFILASALKSISNLDWDELAVGLAGVAGLMTMMVVAAKVLGNSEKIITKGATQMLIMAAAIKVLATACKDLSALSWGELAKVLVGVGVLLAGVSLFLNNTEFSGKTIATATGILILSAAIKVLAAACKDFGEMKWEEIGKGLLAMAGALTAITIAVNFMPKNMISIGAGLIVVSAALLVIANVLEKTSGFSWEEIGKGLVTLGGSMAILAIGLKAMTGSLAGSAALLVAASALRVLTPVLTTLGDMHWDSIIKAIVALAGAFAGVLAVLGVAGVILKGLTPVLLSLGASLVLVSVSALAVGGAIMLAGTGLAALITSVTALITAIGGGVTAIGAFVAAILTSVVALIPTIIVKIGEGIVALCVAIANSAVAIGEAVKTIVLELVDVLVECVPAIAGGALKLIVGVLEALVEYTPSIVAFILQFIISVLEEVANNLPSLIQAAVDVLMSFFAGIVDALKGVDTETLLQGIVGVGLLAAIMAALAAVAALVPGAMVGVLGMGAVIAELALVLAAIGALAQIPGLQWLINEGGNVLQGVGTAIGNFVGSIVGGVMNGITSQLPQIGANLSGFMTNIQPFLDGASSIDPSMLEGVNALAKTILILTAVDILKGLTSWLTGGSSLSGFAMELVPFGIAMKQFSNEIRGIDSEAVSNTAIAGKALAEMATTIPKSGGVVSFFAGEVNMSAFGEQLIPFGTAMKAYSDEVTGIDAAVIQNSVTAGQALMALANTVPNTGGLVSWFTGDNDLKTFGEQLVPFGTAMKAYSDELTGIDAAVVVNSANVAMALVELANSLPNTGGLVSWFTGDNDLAGFGEGLASFGGAFARYYYSVSGVDVGILAAVIVEFRKLVNLANGLQNIDTSGMSNFAQSLTNLGNSGIEGFINAFTNANSRVSAAADTMISGVITAFSSRSGEFTTAGQTAAGGFAIGITSQNVNVQTAFSTIITNCLTVIRNKFNEFNTVGQTTMTKFIAGVRSKSQLAKEAFIQIVNDCCTAIRNKYTDFYNAGGYLIEKVGSGASANASKAKAPFTKVVSDCCAAIRNAYSDFYDAGAYLVKGFASGISANTYMATAKARAMAKAAADAAQAQLEERSPSKVGYRIGNFFGMGFVNGIADYTDKSYDAGATIASSAKEGLRNAVSKISDFIEDGIDSQPTIRPILDLSNVSEKTEKLSALLSRSHVMKISANMKRENTDAIQNQNGDISSIAGNSYNFTQNNYSPKSLSRIDIYRQTKNQFSMLKGLVET